MAVTFVVAAVLIWEEGIESPSYHLREGLGETTGGGKLRCGRDG
jgi:hypothetical protein